MSAIPPDDDRTVMPAQSVPAAAPPAGSAGLGPNALSLGTRLGEFEIVGLVGEGGFGIVYLAYDHSLERKVALKEYMPTTLAHREGATVQVKSPRHAETFAAGLRSFVNEARLLAQFDSPSLVKVYRFWEANGTAYMVMPFYEGVTLRDALRARDTPPDEEWLTLLLAQLLDALDVIHRRQCYHRDIAPDNILMVAEDTPVLLDFGAARRVVNDMAQVLTVILKPGYAPIEQYGETPDMNQGPWTDLYALGAVAYFAITGRAPAASVSRIISDPVVPLVECAAGLYSQPFLAAIDRALSVRPEERPQTVAEFLDALAAGPVQTHSQLRESPPPAAVTPAPAPVSSPRTTTAGAAITPTQIPSAEIDTAELERLLAQHIGPMAKILVARARKSAATGADLVNAVADSIDDEADRTAFVAAARRLLTKR